MTKSDGEELPIEEWFDAMSDGHFPDETICYTTYDECGKPMIDIRFSGLSTLEKVELPVESGKALLKEVSLSYETAECGQIS